MAFSKRDQKSEIKRKGKEEKERRGDRKKEKERRKGRKEEKTAVWGSHTSSQWLPQALLNEEKLTK